MITPEAPSTEVKRLPWNAPFTAQFVEYNRGKREYMKSYEERLIDAPPPVGQMMRMGDNLFVVEFCYIDFETGVVTVALHRETGVKPYVPGDYLNA